MEKTIEIKGMDQRLLFGPADINLKLVENFFQSQIVVRGDIIKIDGDDKEANIISSVFHEMNATINRRGSITSKDVKGDAPDNCENWFVMINTPSIYVKIGEKELSLQGLLVKKSILIL